jgi:hypothetical protein
MAVAFDTLAYAQHLRSAGVPQEQAEAHARAARQYIMLELVTKEDLRLSQDNLALRITRPHGRDDGRRGHHPRHHGRHLLAPARGLSLARLRPALPWPISLRHRLFRLMPNRCQTKQTVQAK